VGAHQAPGLARAALTGLLAADAAATAIFTIISRWLYARWGTSAFGVMSTLCLGALPVARSLREVGSRQ
jgi:hypothetical protein